MRRFLLAAAATLGALSMSLGSDAGAEVDVAAPSLSLTRTFSANSSTISTSEGAPYGDCDFWLRGAASCANESNLGYGPTKVVRVYVCLSGEVTISTCSQQPPVTGPLSEAMLDGIDARIKAFAGTGIRLMVRFTYNFGPIGSGAMDAPIDVIATHIDQLAPILLRHKDLVFALEAGFIGTWGEWHHSTNGNDTAAAQKVVLDKELSYFNGLFPILVRYPGDLIQYTGGSVPPAGLGLHDDYYASNAVDGATWNTCDPNAGYCLSGSTSGALQQYAAQVSTTTLFAGEFGALDTSLQACSALDQYSYTYHPQSISIFPFPPTIGAFLQSQGCATSFYNRVGTRIVLQSADIIGDAAPGGRLYVAATMINDGYGRVIRRRPAALVVIQNGEAVSEIEIPTDRMDLRTLLSSQEAAPSTFQFEFRLPTTLVSGPITLALLFRDPAWSLSPQAAYALPLNSVDESGKPIFDPATGFNRIATFNIGGGASTAGENPPPTFALSGVGQNVIAPGTPGLEYTPDEHMPFLRQPDGTFKLWASGGGTFGTYLFRTSDFLSLGTPTTVFLPSGPGTTAFDADYAGPGSVFPSSDGPGLLMIYHGENHLFSGVDYPGTPFYAGIGLARSMDGGLTWQRQGQIISGHDPQQPTQPPTGAGALTPSAIVARGYIYVIFRELDRESNVFGYALARAAVGSDGAPGSWQKYYQGSFSTPGLGGAFTPLNIVLDPSVPGDQRQPHLSFNRFLHRYLMAMVGNGGIYVLTSPDLINWSAGQVVLPAPVPDSTVTAGGPHNWYPTLVSPYESSDRLTGQTGYLYYAKFLGDGTAHHYMYRQSFTITQE